MPLTITEKLVMIHEVAECLADRAAREEEDPGTYRLIGCRDCGELIARQVCEVLAQAVQR